MSLIEYEQRDAINFGVQTTLWFADRGAAALGNILAGLIMLILLLIWISTETIRFHTNPEVRQNVALSAGLWAALVGFLFSLGLAMLLVATPLGFLAPTVAAAGLCLYACSLFVLERRYAATLYA